MISLRPCVYMYVCIHDCQELTTRSTSLYTSASRTLLTHSWKTARGGSVLACDLLLRLFSVPRVDVSRNTASGSTLSKACKHRTLLRRRSIGRHARIKVRGPRLGEC